MYIIVIAILVAIDQAIKFVVSSNMSPQESITVIDGVFHITYIYNTGAAFGILQGQRTLLTVIASVLVIGILIFIYKKAKDSHFTFPLSLSLICGGGIGNLIDRIRIGGVVDYLDFNVFPPIFNAADIFVCVGCGLLIIHMIFFDKQKKENAEEAKIEGAVS